MSARCETDLRGRRVRLVSMTDAYTRLEPGAEGVIVLVDCVGTLHVQWDDGRRLGLIPGVDLYELVDAADERFLRKFGPDTGN